MPDPTPTPWHRILAVDTSSMVHSVAVIEGDALLSERTLKTRSGHSGALLGAIDGTLRDLGLDITEIDLLVVGAGPGSFTGLRIGLASLKAMAFTRELPLVALSSLEALAHSAGAPGLVVPIIDARKGELYMGLYRRTSAQTLDTLLPDCTMKPQDIVDRVREYHQPGESIVLLGSGLRRYRDQVVPALCETPGNTLALSGPFEAVRASHFASIARHRVTADTLPSLDTLEPNYQRASEAENNAKKRSTKG